MKDTETLNVFLDELKNALANKTFRVWPEYL